MTEIIGETIASNRAWRRADLDSHDRWQLQLSEQQCAQLERVARTLPVDTAEWLELKAADFDAPELLERMLVARAEVGQGFGFSVISGLDISAYSQDMLHRIYWVIAVMLGNVVAQNAKGELIGHVEDLIGGRARGDDDRGYTSSDELRFHCDGGGVSVLFCVRQAATGGDNAIVSLLSIYNELLETHPEHLQVLYRGFPLYQRKEAGDGRDQGSVSNFLIPSFSEKDGRISAWINLKLAELASEVSNTTHSSAERAALACVEAIAERQDMKYSLRLQPGQILVVNNFSLMHKRSAFVDYEQAQRKRLMMRLWLNLDNAPVPVRALAGLSAGFPRAKAVLHLG